MRLRQKPVRSVGAFNTESLRKTAGALTGWTLTGVGPHEDARRLLYAAADEIDRLTTLAPEQAASE